MKASGPPLKICTCELAAVCVERGMCSLPRSVWRGECVPRDWVNCNLVPIPKKGDLRLCDNWRGKALPDVVGKTYDHSVETSTCDGGEPHDAWIL